MFTIKTQVRLSLLVILAASILLVSKARGDGWPTTYQHFQQIREFAQTHKHATVRFTLTNGDMVTGDILRYEKGMDYIWYQPKGTGHNWFKQDAFDVHEILSVEMAEPV